MFLLKLKYRLAFGLDDTLKTFNGKLGEIITIEQNNQTAINDIKAKVGTIQTFVSNFQITYVSDNIWK